MPPCLEAIRGDLGLLDENFVYLDETFAQEAQIGEFEVADLIMRCPRHILRRP